jgi:uncharacterized protein YcbK (DUF882 family)
MKQEFVQALERIRVAYGNSMFVTSGYRCPKYNGLVSSTGQNGPHTTGKAADIHVYGVSAYKLLQYALIEPAITGIGINQRGPYSGRFIHLDAIDDTEIRPRVWSY